ncbi:hypothetical protein INR49_024337 [Caranx melampygus]|nr:hypothetical protein INR49_024337 [Caranx melampygus]
MAFTGKYVLESQENYEEFLKALGIKDPKSPNKDEVVTDIYQNDNFRLTKFLMDKTWNNIFRIGKETELETLDGDTFKTTVTLEGGKLKIQFPNYLYTAEVVGDKLVEFTFLANSECIGPGPVGDGLCPGETVPILKNLGYHFVVCLSLEEPCDRAGNFEISVSGLRWVCKGKVSFKYHFISWEEHQERMRSLQYMPGGPLVDITVTSGKLDKVYMPHWICTDRAEASRLHLGPDVVSYFEGVSDTWRSMTWTQRHVSSNAVDPLHQPGIVPLVSSLASVQYCDSSGKVEDPYSGSWGLDWQTTAGYAGCRSSSWSCDLQSLCLCRSACLPGGAPKHLETLTKTTKPDRMKFLKQPCQWGVERLPASAASGSLDRPHGPLTQLTTAKFHREGTSGLVRAALACACAGGLLLHLRAFVDPEGQLAGVHPLPHHTCLQVLSCSFGDYVHAAVHGQYNDKRDVKGAEGREERVKRLLGDGALRVVRRRRLLPPEQRTDGDDHRQHPHPEHGQQSPLLRHDARVLQRVTHSDVAVDGYYAQAHDGRGAAQHIHRRPDVTEDPSEHPVV